MRGNRFWLLLSLCLAVAYAGCGRDEITSPASDVENAASLKSAAGADARHAAGAIVGEFGWQLDAESGPIDLDKTSSVVISNFEQEMLVGNIAHYSMDVTSGPGPYDIIKLHRVVKLGKRSQPIRARKSVFMLHGDFKDFPGCFLPGATSGSYPDDFGIAVYFAQRGVDVWGMDQAHNSIPADATDFSSMADWDMYKYVNDTEYGMAIARDVRLATGNGYRKLVLLGFSGGAALGFAVVNEETKVPFGMRHVAAFIPVDQGMVSGDADFAAGDCATAEYYADLINSGDYIEPNPLVLFGEPARTDPDGPSALIPGFTNLQAALALAVYPYVEGFPYHFLAGEFDANGLPTGLQYTNVDLWIDFLVESPPWFANAFSRDEYISSCGLPFAPWAADLDLVDLPVQYVSAAGGFGLVYGATLDLMTSATVSELTVQLHPAEEVDLDFAHIDLFTADNAPELAWQPMLEWVMSLRGAGSEAPPRTSSGTD